MVRTLSTAFIAALAAAACGGDSTPDAAGSAPPAAAAAAATRSPCSLLTAEDVALVIGPLAGPPYPAAGATPHAGGDMCRYEAAVDLRSIAVSVTWQNGAEEIGALNLVAGILNDGGLEELKLIDGTPLTGEWDEARVVGCCQFTALRGDQVVTIDVGGTHAMLGDAAKLADAAIRRLEQPLAVDDQAAVTAALGRARPARRSVCELLPRADAEAVAGGALAAAPEGDEESCTYSIPLGSLDSTLDVTLAVTWRDGFREMATIAHAVGQGTSLIGLPDDDSDAEDQAGPWDEVSRSIIGVMAVKRDVLINVESGPFGKDIVEALIAKAIENLGN